MMRHHGLLASVIKKPILPSLNSLVIGNASPFTVEAQFSAGVTASNYASGVTIKANGIVQPVTSAIRQGNHALVYYVIPPTWYGLGGTLTWEYEAAVGLLRGEISNLAVASISTRVVANQVTFDTWTGTGTITQAAGTVTGIGTQFLTELQIGDRITSTGGAINGIVTAITSNTVCIINAVATVALGVGYQIIRPS